MGEGKGLSMYMLIGVIMLGLVLGAIAIFGDGVGSFEDGLVETVKDREHNEGEGIIEDDSNCVLATDDDFFGTTNGSFIYTGSADCVKIPHVIKGVEVTSYKLMFSGTSVSKVVSDNLNITDMSSMFYSSQATELDVSSIDTSNVTNMSSMFAGSKATDLDLSSFDTSNVTNMSSMFSGSKATELDLSSFDTSNVTDMANMFGSSKAKELDLSNFDTSKVTTMSSMFTRSQATELDLSSFDTSNVTNMMAMFFESQTSELDLSRFDTSNVNTMALMFYGSEATKLDLSSFDTSNVTDLRYMSEMFDGSQATTVYVRTQVDADKFNASINKPNGLQVIVKDSEPNEGEGIIEDDSNCVLATDDDFSVTDTGEFRYIGSSDCVKIPHVIKGEDVTSYKYMFSRTKVSKVLSDNPNVTNMSAMFSFSEATELDLSSLDTSNVTDMSGMFSFSEATELDVSSFDTSNVTNMDSMFYNSHATEIDLSSFNTSNVTDMDGMFGISQATELDLSSFDTRNVTDMSFMFNDSQATELDLSSFNTRNVTDMSFMFNDSQAKTVYARTLADVVKLNVSSDKPNGLQIGFKK